MLRFFYLCLEIGSHTYMVVDVVTTISYHYLFLGYFPSPVEMKLPSPHIWTFPSLICKSFYLLADIPQPQQVLTDFCVHHHVYTGYANEVLCSLSSGLFFPLCRVQISPAA